MERVICIVIGYLFGMIQTSYILGKVTKGIDIRDYGSGNAGTTNTMRVLGRKAGFITVIVDILKCIAAVAVVMAIFKGSDHMALLKIYTAAGVILGHDFPFYMGFHGGKGIAATVGMILAFGDLWLMVISIACFFIAAYLTHYISFGSLCLTASFLIGVIIRGQTGAYGLTAPQLAELYILVAALTALAWFQHRSNIRRLLNGTENKVWVKK